MGKSVIRRAVCLVLILSLAACATPQKIDPVVDYCAAVANVLGNCENILAGNSTSRECLESPDTLTKKFDAAMNSLPDKTMPRFKLTSLSGDVLIYFSDYILRSTGNGQSKKVIEAEDIIKDCNAFAAEVH